MRQRHLMARAGVHAPSVPSVQDMQDRSSHVVRCIRSSTWNSGEHGSLCTYVAAACFSVSVSHVDERAPHATAVVSSRNKVQWSEDVIKADRFLGRSQVRFRVPPWVSNKVARDHLA